MLLSAAIYFGHCFIIYHGKIQNQLFVTTASALAIVRCYPYMPFLLACSTSYHMAYLLHVLFLHCFFSSASKNIQTKANITWFLGHIFHGSIPSSYSSYELFHSSTKHTLSFSLSPLHGAQGGSAQSKSFRKYQREGQGRTYTLFPSLHLFPCLSLPRCIALS